ncbi:protein tyrosine phosphatase [Aeromonas salmonicida]|nr:protein tyrosine phosphatase [Aeromonas salmonicida]
MAHSGSGAMSGPLPLAGLIRTFMYSSHPFWSQEVPRVDGQLLLTPCPGTQQVPLPLALGQLRFAGAHGVVTLMTATELAELDLAHLGRQVEQEGMRWFHLPIEDDQAPDADFEHAWQLALPQLSALLHDGKHLVIHCQGGSGRTGLVAAALLISLGQPQQEAMAAIKAHRPKAFTLPAHRQWLDALATRLDQAD